MIPEELLVVAQLLIFAEVCRLSLVDAPLQSTWSARRIDACPMRGDEGGELPADRRPLYRVMDSVEEALEQMLRQKMPGDLCFVCGSLYLVGIIEDLTVI